MTEKLQKHHRNIMENLCISSLSVIVFEVCTNLTMYDYACTVYANHNLRMHYLRA